MSERDPRYNPIKLLFDASEKDTSNEAELYALNEYQLIARRWKYGNEEADKSLFKEVLEMSSSDILKPVVERAYKRVIEEDQKRAMSDYIARENQRADEIIRQWRESRKDAVAIRQKQLDDQKKEISKTSAKCAKADDTSKKKNGTTKFLKEVALLAASNALKFAKHLYVSIPCYGLPLLAAMAIPGLLDVFFEIDKTVLKILMTIAPIVPTCFYSLCEKEDESDSFSIDLCFVYWIIIAIYVWKIY